MDWKNRFSDPLLGFAVEAGVSRRQPASAGVSRRQPASAGVSRRQLKRLESYFLPENDRNLTGKRQLDSLEATAMRVAQKYETDYLPAKGRPSVIIRNELQGRTFAYQINGDYPGMKYALAGASFNLTFKCNFRPELP